MPRKNTTDPEMLVRKLKMVSDLWPTLHSARLFDCYMWVHTTPEWDILAVMIPQEEAKAGIEAPTWIYAIKVRRMAVMLLNPPLSFDLSNFQTVEVTEERQMTFFEMFRKWLALQPGDEEDES